MKQALTKSQITTYIDRLTRFRNHIKKNIPQRFLMMDVFKYGLAKNECGCLLEHLFRSTIFKKDGVNFKKMSYDSKTFFNDVEFFGLNFLRYRGGSQPWVYLFSSGNSNSKAEAIKRFDEVIQEFTCMLKQAKVS